MSFCQTSKGYGSKRGFQFEALCLVMLSNYSNHALLGVNHWDPWQNEFLTDDFSSCWNDFQTPDVRF